jgi:hypothetical protein
MIGKKETRTGKPKPGEEIQTTTDFVDLDLSEIFEIKIIQKNSTKTGIKESFKN